VLVRKTVTALFCDIDESVGLGERLDPEALRLILARYFAEMAAILERHGGTVEKYIGDAIVAVFGIPAVHEDDAVRAVRAASELRERMEEVNDELERDFGVRLALQIGIDTGEVVVGGDDGRGTLATGEAMNVAARLQQAAGPGEILIGKSTYALVKDAVTAGPLETFPVKGKRREVPRRRLDRVDLGAPGLARRLDAPLVGRADELRALTDAFEQAAADHSVRLVTVLGAAGIGKSRLAAELLGAVSDRARTLTGRCLPYGEGITFWPLAQIVREAGGPAAIGAALRDVEDGELVSERLLAAIGTGGEAGGGHETFWAVRRFLEAVASERPLVVRIEDIHWAEPTFLDLVEYLTGWLHDAPILLLCLARGELLDRRPAWAVPQPNALLVVLEPLSATEAGTLLDRLAADLELSTTERERIASAAEGNPLFVEQMVAMAAERDPGAERVRVPPSIQALLAERLDRLEPGERAVLERAAVMGKEFVRRAVVELSPEAERDDVGRLLMALVRRELVSPDTSASVGEDGFRFRHGLIRDAAYAGTSRDARAELHERFARWIEAHMTARLAELEEIVGYHYEQACRNLQELGRADPHARGLAATGGTHLASAGRRALARGDGPAAASLLERAISLLDTTEEREARSLLPELGAALNLSGRLADADRVLTDAIDRAERSSDQLLEASAEMERAVVRLYAEGETAQLAEVAERVIPILDRHRDERGLAQATYLASLTHFVRCEFAAMESVLRQAIAHAREAGDARQERQGLARLAFALTLGPTPVEEAISACRRLHDETALDRTFQAMVGGNLAELEAMRGHFDEARALYAQSKTTLYDLGNLVQAAGVALYAGPVELLAGFPEAAERELRAAYELLGGIGERSALSTVAAFLSRTLLALGRLDDAAHLARETELTAAPDDVLAQTIWRGTAARVEALQGRGQAAVDLVRSAVALAGTSDSPGLRAGASLDLAHVLAAAEDGDPEPPLREAVRLYERKGNIVAARRARAELGTRPFAVPP
jgi:class 3 adenylate cyclase/tetratricopeptide (TPR) repeat protein